MSQTSSFYDQPCKFYEATADIDSRLYLQDEGLSGHTQCVAAQQQQRNDCL